MKKLKISKIGRRQIVLLGLIAMIAVAGYINLNVPLNDEAVPATALVQDPPQEQPAERTIIRMRKWSGTASAARRWRYTAS